MLQKRAHPLCKMCLEHGVVVIADVADHVVPHKGNQHMFWYGELQSLCRSHHNASKRQIENVGFTDDIGTDGYPVDPLHPFNQQTQK